MHHVRNAAILAALAGLTACSENTVAPLVQSPDVPTAATGGSLASLSPADTLHFSITIQPRVAASYDLGNGHSVYFPANAVCDPATSSYGPTEWDKKCDKINKPLTVSVTAWVDSSGHPYEDFSPSIRFLPSKYASDYVILSLTDPAASLDLSMKILYCATPGSACVDEAQSDPTEVTQHDPVTGKVWRRIKHFSGYNVAAGDDGSIGPDPTSLNRLAPGQLPRLKIGARGSSPAAFDSAVVRPKRFVLQFVSRESGYILASG